MLAFQICLFQNDNKTNCCLGWFWLRHSLQSLENESSQSSSFQSLCLCLLYRRIPLTKASTWPRGRSGHSCPMGLCWPKVVKLHWSSPNMIKSTRDWHTNTGSIYHWATRYASQWVEMGRVLWIAMSTQSSTQRNADITETVFIARKVGNKVRWCGDEASRGRGLEGWDEWGRRARAVRRKQAVVGWRAGKQASKQASKQAGRQAGE